METRKLIRTVGLGVLLGGGAWAQVTERASVATGGGQGNWVSENPCVSADGRYVAFDGGAGDLVPGDTNGSWDVFVRDRWSGTTERVSIATDGTQGNSHSNFASISADGRYVAFSGVADNLVPGDTNGWDDAFVRDRQNGTTEMVSVATDGSHGDQSSDLPRLSADGRYVAFRSTSFNLVPGDTNGAQDIFVRDRLLGTTELVSVASDGTLGNSYSGAFGMEFGLAISADGRFVAFQSHASNLVPGDTNVMDDIFVRDRVGRTTERVSLGRNGVQADWYSERPSISADGRLVAFKSSATNLVQSDTNGRSDIFVRDRLMANTQRVSVATGGAQANNDCEYPCISADGRYVAFETKASNLVSGDTNGFVDVYLRDRQDSTTERVSVSTSGAQGDTSYGGYFASASVSVDGRYVAFGSLATNLVAGDTNACMDVFLRDREASGFTSLCHPGVDDVIACPCSNPPGGTGGGCNNFGAGPVDSGTLTATGVAYLQTDTVLLTATGENNTSLTVFWTGSGSPTTGVAHGAGVRCVATNLRRLYTGSASSGAISRPGGGDLPVSARTAALGVPISAGQTRHYFAIYRDPAAAGTCGNTSSTVNLTNAGSITWNL